MPMASVMSSTVVSMMAMVPVVTMVGWRGESLIVNWRGTESLIVNWSWTEPLIVDWRRSESLIVVVVMRSKALIMLISFILLLANSSHYFVDKI